MGGGGEGKHLQKGFLLNIKDSIVHERTPSSSRAYRLAQILLLHPDLACDPTGMGTTLCSHKAPKVLG